uniref:C-type lectin domain-containing protein n=1 Tax=Acrobeloides nanus TaxID=290746 RepID=A0A914DJP0_9BILA
MILSAFNITEKLKTVTSPLYWDDANSLCKSYGGNLVSIHSEEEIAYIYNIFADLSNSGGNGWHWIGLTDPSGKYTLDTYQWTDGTPMDYKRWIKGMPAGPFQGLKLGGAMYNMKSDSLTDEKYKSRWTSAIANQYLRAICEVKRNDIVWRANFQAGFENVPWTLCGRQHSATKQTDVNSCQQKTTDQALGFQYNPQTRDCVIWDQVYGICPLPITDLESYFYIKSDQTSDLTVLLKKVIEYDIFDAIKNGGGNAWQWIGLTDPSGKYTADTYQWSDGSPMDFKKWSPSKPGRPWWTTFHGLKMCGAMYNYKSDPNPLVDPYKSKWISAVCNTVLRSICEVKK